MDKELLTRIDAVAAKLGVGAEHLWEVTVRQVYIESIGWGAVLLVVSAVFYWTGDRFRKLVLANPEAYDTEMWIGAKWLAWFGALCALLLAGSELAQLLNVDYHAAAKIAGMIAAVK